MFEQTFLPGAARTRRTWTVAASFALQILGIGVLILIPLIVTEKLPQAQLRDLFFAPPVPPPAGPKTPPNVKIVAAEKLPPQVKPGGPLTEPTYIPPKPQMVVDPPQETAGIGPQTGPYVPSSIGAAGPATNSVIADFLRSTERTPPPRQAPVVKPPEPKKPEPLRVSMGVQEAKIIHKVIPSYPPLAIQARVSGVVRLSAIIGADGRIRELRITNGHPLLTQAAIDAVRQWRYQPTLLNGEPVEVITTIEVYFNLGR